MDLIRIALPLIAMSVAPFAAPGPILADEPPAAEAIAQMLAGEPLSETTWPSWRARYLEWESDRSGRTKEFIRQLAAYVASRATGTRAAGVEAPLLPNLPPDLERDAVAWLLLAQHISDQKNDDNRRAEQIEAACRKSVALDPNWRPAHSGLAAALVAVARSRQKDRSAPLDEKLLEEAEREIERCRQLEPDFRTAYLVGFMALARSDFPAAEAAYIRALEDFPASENIAVSYVGAALNSPTHTSGWSQLSAPWAAKYPENGSLQVMHAGALMRERNWEEAAKSLARARELKVDPGPILGEQNVRIADDFGEAMSPNFKRALDDLEAHRFQAAAAGLAEALELNPDNETVAEMLASALIGWQGPTGAGGKVSSRIGELCDSFRANGTLLSLRSLAFAREGRFAEAEKMLDRALAVGVDPATILGKETVDRIRATNKPSGLALWSIRFLYLMGGFVAAYALIIASMAATGALLAAFSSRARRRRRQLRRTATAFTTTDSGSPIRARESLLGRLYLAALVVSLLLFYVSVPFVTIGMLAATAGIVFLILQLPMIPVKLLLLAPVIGLGMAYAVIKSVFASADGRVFGVRKDEAECPRLHAALREVAEKTDTPPIDVVYISPGAEIGVHQDGRGPFGLLGVKRRVLTLGLSTMRFLTVSELKAILAHEYAHFSHRDTFYSRFTQQVTISLREALHAMGMSGGRLNYINPFYWFFWLYYHAYIALACGFSRSREFLADNMAARTYGRLAYTSGLKKVATEGRLFHAVIDPQVSELAADGGALDNMYETFAQFRDEQLQAGEIEELFEKLLAVKPSRFATHPTYRERLEALETLPDGTPGEPQPAIDLFEDGDALERELTEYYTSAVA